MIGKEAVEELKKIEVIKAGKEVEVKGEKNREG